jgi:hypothetical protein
MKDFEDAIDFEDAVEQAFWIYDDLRSKGQFSDRDCFKRACRAIFPNSQESPTPERKIFYIDCGGLGPVETLAEIEKLKMQLQQGVDVQPVAETVPLYALVSDCGDGSYAINFTMNSDWIDAQQEAYDNGDVDYEYGIGIDGDGFSYSTIMVPKGSTLKSLGITYDCAIDD